MKIKRLLNKIIIIILIIFLLIPVSINLLGNRALKAGIETAASKALKVDVTLEDVSLSLLRGAVKLDNLVVANPEEYKNDNLLEVGSTRIDAGLKSLMSDTVKIDNMIFNDITVTIEQKGLETNNLQEILDSLPKPDEEPDKEKPGKKLLIKNLELNNVVVKLDLLPELGRPAPLPIKLAPIKMTNLGTDNKLSVAALTAKIIGAIAIGIAEQGVGIIPKEITGPLKDVLGAGSEAIIEGGKEILKGAGEVLKGAGEAGKDISEGLKGLFEKKKED